MIEEIQAPSLQNEEEHDNQQDSKNQGEITQVQEEQQEAGNQEHQDPPVGATQTETLILLANSIDMFKDPDDDVFAKIQVDNHREICGVRSKRFRQWLQREYHRTQHRFAGKNPLDRAIEAIEGMAAIRSPTAEIALRVAGNDESVEIDLGDEYWQSVVITKYGWTISPHSTNFIRNRGMQALPIPKRGEKGIDRLRDFFPDVCDRDFKLLVGWLLGCLMPKGPYPVLILLGEHGSGKSTLARILRSLIDSNTVSLTTTPKDERDLFIRAKNTWIVSLDNLSELSSKMSDAICRISTGGGFSSRKLYSDSDEILINVTRPIMINGIQNMINKSDLIDRAMMIKLPVLSDRKRIPERKLWEQFDAAQPEIIAGMYDVVTVILNEPEMELEQNPRMADFVQWVSAGEKALGWENGLFLQQYLENKGSAVKTLMEDCPVFNAILELSVKSESNGIIFDGTPRDLFNKLKPIDAQISELSSCFPVNETSLSRRINAIKSQLRFFKIEIRRGKSGTRRIILQRSEPDRESKLVHQGEKDPSDCDLDDVDGRKAELIEIFTKKYN